MVMLFLAFFKCPAEIYVKTGFHYKDSSVAELLTSGYDAFKTTNLSSSYSFTKSRAKIFSSYADKKDRHSQQNSDQH